MTGRLYGVGVGPGDPELLTIKAHRIVTECDAVAYFAATGRESNARRIVAGHLRADQGDLRLEYPVTTEQLPPGVSYETLLIDFYDESAKRIAELLDDGIDVAVLCEGDPFFYGSYMYVHNRLGEDYDAEVVPGVPAMLAGTASVGTPLVCLNETLVVLSGVMTEDELVARLTTAGAAVIMKLGRNLDRVRAAVERAGMAERAMYVERVTMGSERIMPLAEADGLTAPYFSMVIIAERHRSAPVTGTVTVVGLGPGDPGTLTPDASGALHAATDLFGYSTYLDMVPESVTGVRHASDNREEADRAAAALDLRRRRRSGGRGVGRRPRRVRHGRRGHGATRRPVRGRSVGRRRRHRAPGRHRGPGRGGPGGSAPGTRLRRDVPVGQPQAVVADRAPPGRGRRRGLRDRPLQPRVAVTTTPAGRRGRRAPSTPRSVDSRGPRPGRRPRR